MPHFLLAAALAHLGRTAEAQSEAAEDRAQPGFPLARVRATSAPDNAVARAAWERYFDGLRKAGVPEA